MTLRFFLIAVLAEVLLGSCAIEEIPTGEGSVLAVMENDQTRTSVTDEGAFTWSAGDQVWLHTTSGNVVGTLSSGAGTSNANFTYGPHLGEMTGMAVYPYNTGHAVSGNELSVVLPASYDLGSNLSNTNAAMYGINVGGSIRFTHLAGVMRFVFKNVPAGTDRFQITLDKKINGTFSADLSQDYPVIAAEQTTVASETTITLNFDALAKTSDISLYVPLPTGTYTRLALDLYAGSQSVWSYSNTVTNTINRKTLKLMPSVMLDGSIGGDIEGGYEPQDGDYVDEYGINHGQGIEIDGVVWAPVNCGYKAASATDKGYPYGKLYQWGRKYGQGYSTSYDADSPTIEAGAVSCDYGQHADNANVFFTSSSSSGYDWLSTRDDKLWNSGTESDPVKTQNDPCPEGWRVPTYAELNNLIKTKSSWTTNGGQNGYWFSGASVTKIDEDAKVFFPAAGYRFYYDGDAYYRGDGGHYWSSKTYGYDACKLHLYAGNVSMGNNIRALGSSVRCVQE